MDWYAILALLMALALGGTLRFALTGRIGGGGPVVNLLTHQVWLLPLAAAIPYVLGCFYKGLISPWPPAAFAAFEEKAGFWGGATAGLAVITVDIWLLYAMARAAAHFAPPEDRHLVKWYYAVNFVVGAFFIVRGILKTGA